MALTLPQLPYATNALEPHIDARTMEIHHGKHHQTYVTNLNGAIEKAPELQNRSLEQLISKLNDVPEAVRTAVRNNGGGHWNHSLFWHLMAPHGGGAMPDTLSGAVGSAFGGMDEFKKQFAAAATGRFGSGWAWLVKDPSGKLTITSTANQDNPLMEGMTALLGLDVWEHAYYLLYQNRRPDYVNAWWNVVNWAKVEELLNAAGGAGRPANR